MGNVIYYAATTLDGFIADAEGGIGWLEPFDHSGEDYGYDAFYRRLGAVVMGSATYRQLLDWDTGWPYADLEAIVVTSQTLPQPKGGNVRFTTEDPAGLVRDLRAAHEKDIWLLGGGKLAVSFAERDLIDEYDIAIMPVVLGAGIRLVEDGVLPKVSKGSVLPKVPKGNQRSLKLLEHQVFPSGVIRAHYSVIRTGGPAA